MREPTTFALLSDLLNVSGDSDLRRVFVYYQPVGDSDGPSLIFHDGKPGSAPGLKASSLC